MSEAFEVAKSITETYTTGMRAGAQMTVPSMERALDLIRAARINPTLNNSLLVEAEAVLLDEIKRTKGLPF